MMLIRVCSVDYYDRTSGTLALSHKSHVQGSCSLRITTVAQVNVELLLSTLGSSDTQVGEWINVIGYVENNEVGARGFKNTEIRSMSCVRIKAIMLWSAGAIRIAEYEKALRDRLSVR